MSSVLTSPARKRLAAASATVLVALAALLSFGPAGASAATCPSFRVLHNDRIGPANLPAGNYTITVSPSAGLSCSSASSLFTRFLQDYDGILPSPWKVVAQGTGKASFTRGGAPGFSVARGGGGGGGNNPSIGQLCRNAFTVNAGSMVGPLFFAKGRYLLYIPAGSGIGCNRASVLFTRFLGAGGTLPFPWRLVSQTATFYKPEHPVRSAFRVEPLTGA